MKKIIPVFIVIFILLTGFTAKYKIDEVNKQIEELNKQINKKNEELKKKQIEVENNKKKIEQKRVIIQKNDINIQQLNKEIEELKINLQKAKEISYKGRYIGTFLATAYDDTPASQGKWVGKTATGMKPRVGVIAVDPKIIPLKTKLYVEGYGECIAGDTGGDIKGKRLDLFFNTPSEVSKYGRRDVKVYIID